MIADKRSCEPQGIVLSSPVCSRRAFLVLSACGLLSACASPSAATRSRPTRTPTPLTPAGPITSESAERLIQLAEFAPRDGFLRGVALAPDNRTLAAGGSAIHTWDVQTGQQLGVWKAQEGQINMLAWSAVNGLLASADNDGATRIWDPAHGSVIHVLSNPTKASALSVAWAPDGTKLVTGTSQGTVELWDTHTGQHLATWAGPPMRPAPGVRNPYAVWGVTWAPDGHTVASNRYDRHVFVWDVASGRLLASLAPDSQPNGVAWKPDGSEFATSDDAGNIQLWGSKRSNANMRILQPRESAGWTYPLAWKRDGSLLICGASSGLVQLWDMRTGTELAPLQAHQLPVWGLALSADASLLATGSDDTTVRLWGVR